MHNDLMAVSFHNDINYLIDHQGQPFVPLKPICENIGMAWQSQHAKLIEDADRFNCHDIVTVGADGKQREMVCLPLRKLNGWLMSISPNKVKPEIKDRLISYQNECDEVLWNYWGDGVAINPRMLKGGVAFDPKNSLTAVADDGNRAIFNFHAWTLFCDANLHENTPRKIEAKKKIAGTVMNANCWEPSFGEGLPIAIEMTTEKVMQNISAKQSNPMAICQTCNVAEFIRLHCSFDGRKAVHKGELYEAYEAYCADSFTYQETACSFFKKLYRTGFPIRKARQECKGQISYVVRGIELGVH